MPRTGTIFIKAIQIIYFCMCFIILWASSVKEQILSEVIRVLCCDWDAFPDEFLVLNTCSQLYIYSKAYGQYKIKKPVTHIPTHTHEHTKPFCLPARVWLVLLDHVSSSFVAVIYIFNIIGLFPILYSYMRFAYFTYEECI